MYHCEAVVLQHFHLHSKKKSEMDCLRWIVNPVSCQFLYSLYSIYRFQCTLYFQISRETKTETHLVTGRTSVFLALNAKADNTHCNKIQGCRNNDEMVCSWSTVWICMSKVPKTARKKKKQKLHSCFLVIDKIIYILQSAEAIYCLYHPFLILAPFLPDAHRVMNISSPPPLLS